VPRPKHVADRREAHRRARMSAFGLLDRIDGKESNCVNAKLIEVVPIRKLLCHFEKMMSNTLYQQKRNFGAIFLDWEFEMAEIAAHNEQLLEGE
jgi:hypothetical protein